MNYRLVCIYEKDKDGKTVLRVEVCNETNTKTLSPFQRRVSLDELKHKVNPSQSQLLDLVNQSGTTTSSSFEISNQNYLNNRDIVSVLNSSEWSYSQKGLHGSLKKAKCPFKSKGTTTYEVGKFVSGVLHVTNLNQWNKNIEVSFRYENTDVLIWPCSKQLLFVDAEGKLLSRDLNLERELLKVLNNGYDESTGLFSLNELDTEQLKEILSKGWTLFVPNQSKKSNSQVYAHSNSSGMTWFSTEGISEADVSNQMLDSFIRSRNYVESDGNIVLFNSKDSLSGSEKGLATLSGATQNVINLYSQDKVDINDKRIKQLLSERVNAKLRPYQMKGVLWLQRMRLKGAGCLLADEMGLGKTLQVIAHLACLDVPMKHLIVAPVSLIYNWECEVNRFAPQLMDKLIFVSYDMLRIHLDDYSKGQYDTIVIDEAQIIKNRETKKYKSIAQLKYKHKIILTGTPIENTIEDMWSHFLMLNPEMKSMYSELQKRGLSSSPEAYVLWSGKLLKPFILRRTKEEVLKDLPEKMEKTVYVELSEKEQLIYGNVHKAIVSALYTGVSGRVNSIVLEGLLRLRQCCVSANILPIELKRVSHVESTKLNTALAYLKTFISEGRKTLIFSQFVSVLHEMESLLDTNNIKYVSLYGDTNDRKTPVERFQNDDSTPVFLISLKAGGVGLNLTKADRVILLDDWWNPAVEDQALGRAHRIGQKNPVLAIRLICKNTVEEKILQLQEQKRLTADVFNNVSDRLTIDDIKQLIDE